MTYTIDLAPELEPRLQEEAARHGQDTKEFLRHVVEERLAAPKEERPFYETATPEEWKRKLRESTFVSDAPHFSDEALRRENLYEDRV